MRRRNFLKFFAGILAALGLAGIGRRIFPDFFGMNNGETEKGIKEKAETKLPNKDEKTTEYDEEGENNIHKNNKNNKTKTGIPLRKLGKTGLEVTIFSLGGEAALLEEGREDVAENILMDALESGINYIDTAPLYGNGLSEMNIGKFMPNYREQVTLATKTHDRSYDGTMRLFEESTNRLQTSHIDVYQIHNVTDENDMHQVLADGGVLKAMEELKKAGDIKFIGATSHYDPHVMKRLINAYDFDTVLIHLNAADIHYNPFQKHFLPEANAQALGITAMKVLSKDRMLRDGGLNDIEKALGYVLSFEISNAILGISEINQLHENIEIAKNFEPMTRETKEEIEALTYPYAEDANWYR